MVVVANNFRCGQKNLGLVGGKPSGYPARKDPWRPGPDYGANGTSRALMLR